MQLKMVGMVVKQMWYHAHFWKPSNVTAQKLTTTSVQVKKLLVLTEMAKQCWCAPN